MEKARPITTEASSALAPAANAGPRTRALRQLGAALAFSLASSVVAIAQPHFLPTLPSFSTAWNLSAGQGAEYRVQCSYGIACVLTVAIVGEEQVGKHHAYWLEIYSHPSGEPTILINKVLFYIDRGKKSGGKLVFIRGIGQISGHPPFELSEVWLQRWARGDFQAAIGYAQTPVDGVTFISEIPSGAPDCCFDYYTALDMVDIARFPPEAHVHSSKEVRVPAGAFACERWVYKKGQGDACVANGAGPFGVVEAFGPAYAYAARASAATSAEPFISADTALPHRRRGKPSAPVLRMELLRTFANAKDRIVAPALRPTAADPWEWLWEERKAGLAFSCLPDLGLPRFRD